MRSQTILFLFAFLAFLTANLLAGDDDLTASELAEALGVNWITIVLPGSEVDLYMIGPALEFGDGTKTVDGGRFGTVMGGSKVKLLVQRHDGQYKCTILSDDGKRSTTMLDIPEFEERKTMTIGGTQKHNEHLYIIKVSKTNSPITSDAPLKPNEFGVRLILEETKKENKSEQATPRKPSD